MLSGTSFPVKMSNMSLQRFLTILACLSSVSALYFHIGETEKKCFIEEIPDETMVVGKFTRTKIAKNKQKYQNKLLPLA